MEAVPALVEIVDDRLETPVAVAVDDIAPITCSQELVIETGIIGPWQRMWANSYCGFNRIHACDDSLPR